MRKIIILSTTLLITFLIYNFFKNQTLNYVSIGDSLSRGINPYNIEGYGYNNYVKNYLERNNILGTYNNYYYNNSIEGLKNDIQKNKTIINNNKEYFVKKILRESDIVVISVGMDELAYNFDNDNIDNVYRYFNIMYENITNLVKEIKKYAYNDILFVGYYNPTNIYTSEIDEFFYYVNNELYLLMKKNNIKYIDIYESIKGGNYMDNPNNHHINTHGYLKIAGYITAYIDKKQ